MALTNRMNFRKIYIADFGPSYRAFIGRFLKKKFAIQFSENEGVGSKAVWNFSENSSDLLAPTFL